MKKKLIYLLAILVEATLYYLILLVILGRMLVPCPDWFDLSECSLLPRLMRTNPVPYTALIIVVVTIIFFFLVNLQEAYLGRDSGKVKK